MGMIRSYQRPGRTEQIPARGAVTLNNPPNFQNPELSTHELYLGACRKKGTYPIVICKHMNKG